MRYTLLTLAALLTGCAMTPAELMERGERHTFVVSNAPAQAAECAARNAENKTAYMAARTHYRQDGSAETIVRAEQVGTLVVFQFTGREAAAHVTPNIGDTRGYAAELLKGC